MTTEARSPMTTAATSRFAPRRVYAVAGVPPEVMAYGMAKYSRSAQGMLESLRELNAERAAAFLQSWLFAYGHASIADMAHLHFGVEQISILAAIRLVDEQLWDGQERSTRYQPFQKTGWYTPASLTGTPAEGAYEQAMVAAFASYRDVGARVLDLLLESVPRPDGMDEASYRRTLRARAFDVARYLLPLATNTSVGQVVTARTLERQVARLLASPQPEIRAIGAELRRACEQPAETPLAGDGALGEALAPTLVKYTNPSEYEPAVRAALGEAAADLLRNAGPADRAHAVELAPQHDPLDEVVATLLYEQDKEGRSYAQVLAVVRSLDDSSKRGVLDLSVRDRGSHDGLLRAHQAGYAFVFDVLMDIGAFRDLHRHRRCIQVAQPLTRSHGPDPIGSVLDCGLGSELAHAARAAGVDGTMATAYRTAEDAAEGIVAVDPLAAEYLLPLGYRTRALFKMDWAQVAYLTELRTGETGHFSYRRVAWAMRQALAERCPALVEPIRATDPELAMNLLRR